MNPRHHSPPADQAATAPYNFVPLPEAVFVVQGRPEWQLDGRPLWEAHDCFGASLRSGWIEVRLSALTPLHIGGGRSDDKRTSRLRRDPEGRPMVPGSSLRGMVRNLVEVLSFSKPASVTREQPFFRAIGKQGQRLPDNYHSRMVREGARPKAGFLEKKGRDWYIVPAEHAAVSHALIQQALPDFRYGRTPDELPMDEFHDRAAFARIDGGTSIVTRFSDKCGDGLREVTLVLTGSAPTRPGGKEKSEFVFWPREGADKIPIPEAVLDRFLSEDQITRWQKRRFRKSDGFGKDGGIKDGQPIFYITNDEFLRNGENPEGIFFGRAGMFRLPYERSPHALVPEKLRGANIDLAEALFGRVPVVGQAGSAIRGRVQFGDLLQVGAAQRGGPATVLLSSPKITCYPLYLTQNGGAGPSQLTTYLEDDTTTVRGHKVYWHRREVRPSQAGGDTQITTMDATVAPETRFAGRIRFENLNDIELGALLSALRLPDSCAHRLGMAKPLGYGSVRIAAALRLIDRNARYRDWEGDGVNESDGREFESAFAGAIRAHAMETDEPTNRDGTGLDAIYRIAALFRLLSFPGPQADAIGQMGLLEFKRNRVLQSPFGVFGLCDPWQPNPPRAGATAAAGPQRMAAAGNAPRTVARNVPQPAVAGRRFEHALKSGQKGRWIATDRKTGKGAWVFKQIHGDLLGIMAPGEPPPTNVAVDREYDFWVKSPGKVHNQLTAIEPRPRNASAHAAGRRP